MLLLSVLCIAIGAAPGPLYAFLPYGAAYVPYTGDHVVSQLQLLLFSGLAFFLLLGMLRRTETITLDTDWFYRRLGSALTRRLTPPVAAAWRQAEATISAASSRGLQLLEAAYRSGPLSRPQASGTVALIAITALTAYLILGYMAAAR